MNEQRSHPATTNASIAGGDQLKLWAGKGTGSSCAQCGQPIAASDIEYEIADHSDSSSRSALKFHVRCFDEWRNRQAGHPGKGTRETP